MESKQDKSADVYRPGSFGYDKLKENFQKSVEGRSTTPAPPLGEELKRFNVADIPKLSDPNVDPIQIRNCRYVGSYNWLDDDKPTIMIPGSPPMWTPPHPPPQLVSSSDNFFKDENAGRFPSYPMQPAVQAVIDAQAATNYHKIDIFACSSTLRHLINFLGRTAGPFRFIIEVVGRTVFFIRREKSPQEVHNEIGLGYTMPRAYTTWQENVKNSESHQRIIQYDVAGLQCLVRFRAHGYLPNLYPDLSLLANDNGNVEAKPDFTPDVDVSTHCSTASGMDETSLSLRRGGCVVPQTALFELKTRKVERIHKDNLGIQLPHLWITQVPNSILAFHRGGVFNDIPKVDSVENEIEGWASANRTLLSQFGSLLQEIVNYARSTPDFKLEIEYAGHGSLFVREPGGEVGECLPPQLRRKWDDGGKAPAGKQYEHF